MKKLILTAFALLLSSQLHVASAMADDWTQFTHDASGNRASADTAINNKNAKNLYRRWTFQTAGAVHGTPAVVNGVVYAGDANGNFYALQASNGKVIWKREGANKLTPSTNYAFSQDQAITASPLVTQGVVVIGDIQGNLYGVNANTGATIWTDKYSSDPSVPGSNTHRYYFNANGTPSFWGSATLINPTTAVIGVASNDEFGAGVQPWDLRGATTCCYSRGAVIAFNPLNGNIKWQADMIDRNLPYTGTDADIGPAGDSVWATPTYSAKSNLIYVATGNQFTAGTHGDTPLADAVVALDPATGATVWKKSFAPNSSDVWNYQIPWDPNHPDVDFADSPHVYTLGSGQLVVGIGQKSGTYWVLDALTGNKINSLDVQQDASSQGGINAGGAYYNGVSYINGVGPSAELLAVYPNAQGEIDAVRNGPNGQLTVLWRAPGFSYGSQIAGLTYVNGVLLYEDSAAFPSGVYGSYGSAMVARDAATGKVLANIPVSNASVSGPSVSNGMVFVGEGIIALPSFYLPGTTGAITAYTVQ